MIKIKSMKFFDHIIFGNQLFDFTIDGETPADTIVFAGENGSGKTKLLEELQFSFRTVCFVRKYDYSKATHEIVLDLSTEDYCDFHNEKNLIDTGIVIVSKSESGEIINRITCFSNGKAVDSIKKIGFAEKNDFIKFNCLYSDVDVNYKPHRIVSGITNKRLDDGDTITTQDIASEIIQLLIDIATQDSFDLVSWCREHKNEIPTEEVYDVRLNRFIKAFEKIFGDKIKYKGIKNNIMPIFEKNGHEIEITSLSSGEKQIIFRGVHLLKNKNSLKGVPVFIDEPEISMHPVWEKEILNYYRNLFLENNIETSQMFFATHSEYVLSTTLKYNNAMIIKLKEHNHEKIVYNSNGNILPTMTLAEIKYNIFDSYTTDFHSLLYGYIQENCVENEDGVKILDATVKETDNWLINKSAPLKKYQKYSQKWEKDYDYDALPTYVRNCIDHPDDEHKYTEEELKNSIDYLIKIIKNSID